jgi:hypothetical protein
MLGLVLLSGIGGCNLQGRRFVAACMESTDLSKTACECAERQAREDLSPKAIDFMIATMEKRDERARELREELTLGDMARAGTWMVTAGARCALRSDSEARR